MITIRDLLVSLVLVVGVFGDDPTNGMAVENHGSSPAVQVDLYYESLCPYSRKFILNQLYPVHRQFRGSGVMNVTLIPFGNAGIKASADGQSWAFNCQHGPNECLGNIITTCVLNQTTNYDLQMAFVYCFENMVGRMNPHSALAYCAPRLHINATNVTKCVNSHAGNEMQHAMGLKTKHQKVHYVPWIVVDGFHTRTSNSLAYSNLKQTVCNKYKGDKPYACTNSGNEGLSVGR